MAKKDGLSYQEILNVNDFKDLEGRPLGEHNASESTLTDVPMALKTCLYKDSRYQNKCPMNVSALKQLSIHWDDSIEFVKCIRVLYTQYKGSSLTTIVDSLNFCSILASIPSWLVFREDNPIKDDEIPPTIAAVYKIIIGMHRVLQIQFSSEIMNDKANTALTITASDMAMYADLGGFLIGSKQVCAGSIRQIENAIAAVMFDSEYNESKLNEVNTLIGDIDKFFSFAESISRVDYIQYFYRTYLALNIYDVSSNLQFEADQRLERYVSDIVNELDGSGTIESFYHTRSIEQLDKLIKGLLQLTAFNKLGEAVNYFSDIEKLAEKILDETVTLNDRYIHFESLMIRRIQQEESLLNSNLGRANVKEYDVRSLLREEGGSKLIDLLSMIEESEFLA